MKKLLFLSLLFCSVLTSQAQVIKPVKWSFSTKKIDATTYEVSLTATIEKGWHIYSQFTAEGGPLPTEISFSNNPLTTLDGKTKENGKLEQKHEELFDVAVKQFSNKVAFVQVIKLKKKVKTSVTGEINYMVCNDKECLPPETIPFTVSLK